MSGPRLLLELRCSGEAYKGYNWSFCLGLYCLHFPETEVVRQGQARNTQGLVFCQLQGAGCYLYRWKWTTRLKCIIDFKKGLIFCTLHSHSLSGLAPPGGSKMSWAMRMASWASCSRRRQKTLISFSPQSMGGNIPVMVHIGFQIRVSSALVSCQLPAKR